MERSLGRDEVLIRPSPLLFDRLWCGVKERRQLRRNDCRQRLHELVLLSSIGKFQSQDACAAVRGQQRNDECPCGAFNPANDLFLTAAKRGGNRVVGASADLWKPRQQLVRVAVRENREQCITIRIQSPENRSLRSEDLDSVFKSAAEIALVAGTGDPRAQARRRRHIAFKRASVPPRVGSRFG